jgi:hypothetical protein
MQRGAAASAGLKHCATSGVRQVTSHRLPLFSALHELTPFEVEFVVLVVLPTLLELSMFVELLELTVLRAFVETLELTELVLRVELPVLWTC